MIIVLFGSCGVFVYMLTDCLEGAMFYFEILILDFGLDVLDE